MSANSINGFGTIRNNTALKRRWKESSVNSGFGTIRNNTALKQNGELTQATIGFGTIRNNTALKLRCDSPRKLVLFWNHSKQHSSKTSWTTFSHKIS